MLDISNCIVIIVIIVVIVIVIVVLITIIRCGVLDISDYIVIVI